MLLVEVFSFLFFFQQTTVRKCFFCCCCCRKFEFKIQNLNFPLTDSKSRLDRCFFFLLLRSMRFVACECELPPPPRPTKNKPFVNIFIAFAGNLNSKFQPQIFWLTDANTRITCSGKLRVGDYLFFLRCMRFVACEHQLSPLTNNQPFVNAFYCSCRKFKFKIQDLKLKFFG